MKKAVAALDRQTDENGVETAGILDGYCLDTECPYKEKQGVAHKHNTLFRLNVTW